MKKALFLSGGWEGHEPKETCELFAGLLRERGFEAEIATSLDALLDADKLAALDLIVPCFTMSEITGEQVKALSRRVAEGCGLGGWHGGMGDAFRQNVHYQFMVGGQWVAHPGGATKRYRVHVRDRHHPITRGIPSFDFVSEQYYMHVDPGNNALATTVFGGEEHDWIEGTVMPVVWTRSWGEGRVFYSSLGHVLADFDTPEARQLALNGLLWAARAEA